jgi:hypothetical protein
VINLQTGTAARSPYAGEPGRNCAARAHPLYKGMSEHKVTLKWERGAAEFSYQKYPRDHTWIFDGGYTMTATAAPAYLGNPANVERPPPLRYRRRIDLLRV